MGKNYKETQDFFEGLFEDIRREDPDRFEGVKDFTLFTYVCLKYFLLGADDEDALDYITDKTKDCSIDAICNDASEESTPLVFIQTKYRSTFDSTTALGEIEEIKQGVKKLRSQKYSAFNDDVVATYQGCKEATDSSDYSICYFTSAIPTTKTQRTARAKLENENVRIFFGDEIRQQIEGIRSGKGTIDYGEIEIDKTGNILHFEDSIIVNLSASSLKALYSRYQTQLLGLNLRYYVKEKNVDNGLRGTITNNQGSFWYLNNGIVIVCKDFTPDGKIIKLRDFSIVNGGQTCRAIYKNDFENDFYIVCKIVKTEDGDNAKGRSSEEIATATNSQKPIKDKDLQANKPEQRILGGELKKVGVQYITKSGMLIDTKFKDRTKHTNIDQIGKLVLSSVLQHPESRSNSQNLYRDPKTYSLVYMKTNAQVMADLLKIDYYYKDYSKTNLASENPILVRNARTFIDALIVYTSYYYQHPDAVPEAFGNSSEQEKLLDNLACDKFVKMEKIIVNKIDDEKELFYRLFDILSETVLVYKFQQFKGGNPEEAESNYLKKRESYISSLGRLNAILKKDKELVHIATVLFQKKYEVSLP